MAQQAAEQSADALPETPVAVLAGLNHDLIEALKPRFARSKTHDEHRRLRALTIAALIRKARHLIEEDPYDKPGLEAIACDVLTGELQIDDE